MTLGIHSTKAQANHAFSSLCNSINSNNTDDDSNSVEAAAVAVTVKYCSNAMQ